MDTKTFQKPKNLYQYLYYNSYHPRSVFKGLIKGECISTNSSPELNFSNVDFWDVNTRLSLSKKLYVLSTSKLSENSTTNRPTCKETYLQMSPTTSVHRPENNHLTAVSQNAPRPRFITLKSQTLARELIRSKVHPTDEQFIDIILTVNGDTNTNHKTSGKMPQLQESSAVTTACNHPRCVTCKHLNCNSYFRSTATGKTFPIRHSFTCTSSNIMYLITCTKCKKQYNYRLHHYTT